MREEERMKRESLELRLKEIDAKNKKEDEKGKKKLITYDSNGDIIIIRNIKADGLPNPILNPPYKIKGPKIA